MSVWLDRVVVGFVIGLGLMAVVSLVVFTLSGEFAGGILSGSLYGVVAVALLLLRQISLLVRMVAELTELQLEQLQRLGRSRSALDKGAEKGID
jgi:uncharacterized membrane protein